MAAVSRDHALIGNGQWLGDSIMDIIPADGVGVVLNGAPPVLSGLVPSPAQFERIVRALGNVAAGEVERIPPDGLLFGLAGFAGFLSL